MILKEIIILYSVTSIKSRRVVHILTTVLRTVTVGRSNDAIFCSITKITIYLHTFNDIDNLYSRNGVIEQLRGRLNIPA